MKNKLSRYTLADRCILTLDLVIRTLAGTHPEKRQNPAFSCTETDLSVEEKRRTAGLMRINHVGEVCAQALYLGQALTARSVRTREHMQLAAEEEIDHLIWCAQRLQELNSKPSYFIAFWFFSALCLGSAAGFVGDRWSLAFLAETEAQVVRHLEFHLQLISAEDLKTRAILSQMKIDEAKHQTMAIAEGAAMLPTPIKSLMRGMAKIMTTTVYYV